MSTQTPPAAVATGMAAFDRTTSRWGRLTMLIGLVVSLSGSVYLGFFSGLDIEPSLLFTGFAVVASTFFVIWLVEPVTYFPILGPAAMYQAFMIGNISNKLLPSALVAQANLGVKGGTPKGSLAAVMAICGAATIHLTSLLVFVGILGTWLITVVPPEMMEVVRTYISPAIFGAVFVQAVMTVKQVRPVVIAVAIALIVQLVLVPAVPSLWLAATGIVVITTAVVAWFARDRRAEKKENTLAE
ncbi:hypothetical protein [Zhihengliuella salsuginis]|uniref:Integral membrane protein n=1 Tax=Zhihengliuella salsuginis TaxID=578222 RepID=A0ABQ3GFL0_9MICC|nr:hypothetical protein [Zhihengliuella salsuginis]GHD02428.1 hypothetical protein GCM10008096_07540 [Zhihengliuella salsuginis]